MRQRDILWIAAIWIVLLLLAATVAAVFADDDPATNDALGAGLLAATLGVVATGLYLYGRRQSWDRRDVLALASIWVPLLGAAGVLTAATGHSYGAGWVAGAVGALLTGSYLERSRRRRRAQRAAQLGRTCPQCGTHMHPEARICSQCGSASAPWTFYNGGWWTRDEDGKWLWLDTETGVFGPYPDEDLTP